MAWNPSPEVAAARDFGTQFDANRVVILWTTRDGLCGVASYGQTKTLCEATKPIADKLYEDAMEYFDETNERNATDV